MIFADKQQDVDKISQRLIDEEIFHGKYHSRAVSRSVYCEVSDFSQNVFVSTNKSSKGLEADCVILYVTPHDEKKLSITSEWWLTGNLYYVLATRARKNFIYSILQKKSNFYLKNQYVSFTSLLYARSCQSTRSAWSAKTLIFGRW